jgi:AraC-like DNA-binding protein/ligand-binding sensor protein
VSGISPCGPPQVTADWFRNQFEKDLRFFQLFLLLINKSCPIKRIDLVWAEDGPAERVGLRQKLVCTEEALRGPCARLLSGGPIFEPAFCNHMAACAGSDKAAERRVRESGKGESYRCHAGLIDIAVPVFAEGQHIATLLSGQVRRNPPAKADLEQLRLKLEGNQELEWRAVQESYWQVPIVSDADIQSALEVLGVFAEYLGNTWSRLSEAIRGEQRRSRESHLARKEFAYLALEGGIGDRATLQDLIGDLGFKRYPNRVLVVKLENEEEYHTPAGSFDLALTRAVQSVEELCESVPNTACAYLRNRGICVFFRDRAENGTTSSFKAQTLASRFLRAISGATDLHARVGIGSIKSSWHRLVDSYHEAGVALAACDSPIACYSASSQASDALATSIGEICRDLSEGRLQDVRTALAKLPLKVRQTLGDLQTQRNFYSYALESLSYASRAILPTDEAVDEPAQGGTSLMSGAASTFALQEEFSRQAEMIVDAVRRVFSGKRDKTIERGCRLIRKELDDPATAPKVSISRVAAAVGMSTGYFGRIFKREVGMTFERYLMTARVERSKRALLDPLNTVAAVAEQIGFMDPTYYAKVFRKITGCSPTEYRENPALYPIRNVSLRVS